ncbi:MAG: HTTM domain-containing protein [Planctomycetia bacterium]
MKPPLAVIARAAAAFDHWVRDPVDPRPLAWFRSWLGLLSLVNLWLLWPDMPMWLGNDGVIPPDVHRGMVGGDRLSIYLVTGYSVAAVGLIRLLGLVGGLGLWLGICPRCAAACAWLAAASYSWRNMEILHSGDTLIRIGTFFLIFARSDGALSLPRAVRRSFLAPAGQSPEHPLRLVPAWPQRILQLQLCVVYFTAAVWKALGPTWRNGTAVGIVLQLGEFQRFPIPDFLLTQAASRAMTYGTLAFEFGFPLLVWFPALRLPVLLAGLVFHAGLDWVMNVQLFQWLITAYYLLWLEPTVSPSPASCVPTSAPACNAPPAPPAPRSSSSPAPCRARR